MRWAVIAAVALVAGAAAASPRATDDDARARLAAARAEIEAHMHALRYAEARAAAEAALAIGAAGSDEVAQLARVLGETSAALDDAAAAERWFVLWLSLDPRGDLPAGSSPKLTAPLVAARGRVTRALVVQASDRDDERVIQIAGDPGANVAAAELVTIDTRGARASAHVPITAAAPYVVVPARVTGYELSLRDRHGNELLADTWQAPAEPRPVTRSRSIWRRPLPYLIGAAVTGGLGGVFVWRRAVAKDDLDDIIADSEHHTLDDAEAARSRAERHGWLSVASFAAAGAFVATAVIMATTGGEQPVAVTVNRDLVMLAVDTTF